MKETWHDTICAMITRAFAARHARVLSRSVCAGAPAEHARILALAGGGQVSDLGVGPGGVRKLKLLHPELPDVDLAVLLVSGTLMHGAEVHPALPLAAASLAARSAAARSAATSRRWARTPISSRSPT